MYAFLQMLIADQIVLARRHHATVCDAGAPEQKAPLRIANPSLAHAIYGRLSPRHPSAQYTFPVIAGMRVQALLLIPLRHYERGFLARMTLFGPGLPVGGVIPQSLYVPLCVRGRGYQFIQAHLPPLPDSGVYTLEVRQSAGEGVYCLCLGEHESGPADATTQARIERLLDG